MKDLLKNGGVFIFFACSFRLSLGYVGKCLIGKEVCSCEYIDCQGYNKTFEYCEKHDYNEKACNSSDYYFYPTEFCNLTSVSCLEINKVKYTPDFNFILPKQEKYTVAISFKKFSMLNESLFRGLNITSLDLAYNHIGKIEANTFDKINGLKELNISINRLREITLDGLQDLEILDASRNEIDSIYSHPFSSMLKLKVLILRYNLLQFMANESLYFNTELRMLDLRSNYLAQLDFVPVLKKVVLINLDENEFTRIESDTFANLKSLKVLRLRNVNIKTVDDRAFYGLVELRKILVNSNKIKNFLRINESFYLQFLSISANLLKSIERDSIIKLKSLNEVRLNLNQIETIDDFSLDFPSVTKLDLADNRISTLNGSNVFYGLKKLTDLNLENNLLTVLSSFLFKNLVSLASVNLENNRIEYIQENSFYGLSNLKYISLKSNQLKKLNKSMFCCLTNLTELDLDSNRLATIDNEAFMGLTSLKVLKLSNNKLNFIKSAFFNNLTSLIQLYLTNNQISSIHINSFYTLRNLTQLDLNNNNIFTLNPRFLMNMDSLEKLNLEENTIHSITIQTFMFARNLKELNLSYNSLTILKPGIFSSMSKLKLLNLTMNPIATIYLDCFFGLSQLVSLKLANDIENIRIVPYTVSKEMFLPKLDSLFFKNDSMQLIGQFNLAKLQTVSINYCKLKFNNSQRLIFTNMSRIYMQSLNIEKEYLNKFISEFGENLLELDLSFNLIKFNEPNQFISKSKSLEKLWLAGVGITQFYNALDLQNFSRLSLIDLSYNSLEVVGESFFKFNPELVSLNLSHNSIRQVEDYSLFYNLKLSILDLSYNQIEMLLDDVFAVTYYTIKKLYLNNNRLKVFSADYRFQSMFEGIRLDNNNLTEFPTAIYFNVKYADELNFGGNPISALGPYLFSITNRIFYLGFSNCLINSIGSDSFTKLHTLITLDLSQNRIASLNNEYFPELSSLKVLNLSHNEIYFVSKDVFQSLNCLTNLDLLNNRIMEIEDMAFLNLNSLKIMGLDENPLVDLFKNYTFTGLNQIKFMDISNTVIFNIEIVKSIISQIKLRLLRVVLDNIKFYDSIEIALPLNLTEPYSKDFCFYISYLSRNLITLNLKNDDYVEKFVADCRDWSTDFYQATLVDYN